jgi:hypothetical protein
MTDPGWVGVRFIAIPPCPLSAPVFHSSALDEDVPVAVGDCSRVGSFLDQPGSHSTSFGGMSMMTVDRQPVGIVCCPLRHTRCGPVPNSNSGCRIARIARMKDYERRRMSISRLETKPRLNASMTGWAHGQTEWNATHRICGSEQHIYERAPG